MKLLCNVLTVGAYGRLQERLSMCQRSLAAKNSELESERVRYQSLSEKYQDLTRLQESTESERRRFQGLVENHGKQAQEIKDEVNAMLESRDKQISVLEANVGSLEAQRDEALQNLEFERNRIIKGLSHDAAIQRVGELEAEIAELMAQRDEARANAYDQPRDSRGRFISPDDVEMEELPPVGI